MWQKIVFVLVFWCLAGCAQARDYYWGVPEQGTFLVVFKHPLGERALKNFVDALNAPVLELLHYGDNGMVSGYTVPEGRGVLESFRDMFAKHREFLVHAKEVPHQVEALDSAYFFLKKGNFLIHAIVAEDVGSLTPQNSTMVGEVLPLIPSLVPFQNRFVTVEAWRGKGESFLRKVDHAPTQWAPDKGVVRIWPTGGFSVFRFARISAWNGTKAYVHEIEFSDVAFADYGSYWSSNVSSPYVTVIAEGGVERFGIGSTSPESFRLETPYYMYVSLEPGLATGAVVAVRGVSAHKIPRCHGGSWCILAAKGVIPLVEFNAPLLHAVEWK